MTAHRVLLRLRHLAIRLEKLAAAALKEDREKPLWFYHPELSFLAQKVNSVLNNLLVRFKEYFTRAVPPCPTPQQSQADSAPAEDIKEDEVKREPEREGERMDSSHNHSNPAPAAAVKQEAEATPMQVDEPPKQSIPSEEEQIAELQSRWSRRMDLFASRFPVPAHDLLRLSNAITQIYIFTQVTYAEEDITEDPTCILALRYELTLSTASKRTL